jgi:opacity protein-like surface antigen
MLKKSFIHLLTVGVLTLSSGVSALADDFDRPGAYIGVNGVYGISLFQNEISEAFGLDDDFKLGDSGGINARIGYRALSWLAFEAEYEWLHAMKLESQGFAIGDFKPNTVTGNLKLIIPSWRIQPYLLLGAGVAIWKIEGENHSQSSTGFAGRVGLGLETYLSKHWVFNIEATGVLNTNDIDPSEIEVDLDSISHLYYVSISAGIVYRF